MKVYEKPNMRFESLEVFEKIANYDCWSHNQFEFDFKNHKHTGKGNKNSAAHKKDCKTIYIYNCDPECNLKDSAEVYLQTIFRLNWKDILHFNIVNMNNSGTNTNWCGIRPISC